MTELVKYDAACRALATATRVDDVKAIKDKAEAMRAYGRQINNPQLEADAWAIRKRAEDKLGELSTALEKARTEGRRGTKRLPIGGKSKTDALKAAGISTSAANRYEKFNALPEAEKERRIARGRAAIEAGRSIADAIIQQDDKKNRRDERERELADKIGALPDKRYGVIVADPEWQWEPWSRETGMDRAAANHYPTSVLPVITARNVPSISSPDCVLFLWATIPMLPHALVVMGAWGFDYASNYCWGKDHFGTGFWSREKHELLLIGKRGKVPCPAPGTQWDSFILAPRGKHSEKPECFLEMIEAYYPNIPKIELNRRGPARPGWDAWGNEAAEAAE
jgi:N6-adenosine-specific RNA methylase IME4